MARQHILLFVIASFVHFLNGDSVVEMQLEPGEEPMKILNLTVKNCTKPRTPFTPLVVINSLNISPSPIPLNGSLINFGISVDVKQQLNEFKGLRAKMQLLMVNVNPPSDLCMVLPSRICDIRDVCTLLEDYEKNCPKFLTDMGFECKCPIRAKHYKVSNVAITLPAIPSSFSGAFEAVVKLYYGQPEVEAGCAEIKFCLNTCKV